MVLTLSEDYCVFSPSQYVRIYLTDSADACRTEEGVPEIPEPQGMPFVGEANVYGQSDVSSKHSDDTCAQMVYLLSSQIPVLSPV